MPLHTPNATTNRKLRACAFWNDEAGATAWQNAQASQSDERCRAFEADAARLWSQSKRLHAQADAIAVSEAA